MLDFGLAKVGDAPAVSSENSPTLSVAQTAAGIILGTAAYMSPEQAKGKPVDRRADIWAFGCILCEMLTGQAAFRGEDVSEILASVIKGDANLELVSAGAHPDLRKLLGRCLQKDLKKRYQDIGDVRIELEQLLANPKPVPTETAAAKGGRSILRTLPWIAATAIVAAILGGFAVWESRKVEYPSVVRFSDVLPEGHNLTVAARQNRNLASRHGIAISRDGNRIAYAVTGGIRLRSLSQMDARIVPGTEGESTVPFFSPDGQWLGFWSASDRQLKKIPLSGGAPIAVCEADDVLNATWNSDNSNSYDSSQGTLMRVSADGGTPATILEEKDERFYDPQLLPDGKTMLFILSTAERTMDMKVAVQSLESGKRKVLFEGQSARYLPTGHIVYVQQPILFAVPFDPDKSEVTGGRVAMIQDIYMWGNTHYAVSDSGTLVYVPRSADGQAEQPQNTLVWVDRNGKEQPIAAQPNAYTTPQVSPDGTEVALTVLTGGRPDIWIWNIASETMTRLTFDQSSGTPLWTIDGKQIVFQSQRSGDIWLFRKAADGTGKDEQLGPSGEFGFTPCAWSKDGKTLVLARGMGGGASEIGAISMGGNRKWRPLLKATDGEFDPQISPDGQWMAYVSDESGRYEVYVRPFPDVEAGRWQISTSGGVSPLWSPEGEELFYRSGDAVMAVSAQTKPTFSFQTPKLLFRGAYASSKHGNYRSWDISPDGRRFLLIKGSETGVINFHTRPPALKQINVVLNWFEELKKRVQVK